MHPRRCPKISDEDSWNTTESEQTQLQVVSFRSTFSSLVHGTYVFRWNRGTTKGVSMWTTRIETGTFWLTYDAYMFLSCSPGDFAVVFVAYIFTSQVFVPLDTRNFGALSELLCVNCHPMDIRIREAALCRFHPCWGKQHVIVFDQCHFVCLHGFFHPTHSAS